MTAGVGSVPVSRASEEPAQQPHAPPDPLPSLPPSDQEIEAAALEGSEAIRRIIAERNELRRERDRLSGINEELRYQNEKTNFLRDHYRQLALELLVQLRQMHQAIQQMHQGIQEASRKVHELSADTEKRDSALMALARRFSTTGNGG